MPMNLDNQNKSSLLPWKRYLAVILESFIAFYLATFSMAVYFTYRGADSLILSILLSLLYLFTIIVCAKRVLAILPVAALMLIIPLAPVIVMIVIMSLIPIIQYL
jgi:hypothetical protein